MRSDSDGFCGRTYFFLEVFFAAPPAVFFAAGDFPPDFRTVFFALWFFDILAAAGAFACAAFFLFFDSVLAGLFSVASAFLDFFCADRIKPEVVIPCTSDSSG